MQCDGIHTETRFHLSAEWMSPFKSAGASVQSTRGSQGVRISGSNAGYTMFRGSVTCTDYPLHSPVSPSLPLPCVTVCHHISTGLYCCLYSGQTMQDKTGFRKGGLRPELWANKWKPGSLKKADAEVMYLGERGKGDEWKQRLIKL
jgi:hypothetical protein